MSKSNLATLIGSRICHDLISPIGAINNGLELLSLTGEGGGGSEMELINQSVVNASARIRFFRIAYGAASRQDISRNEVTSIISDVMDGGRLTVAWGPLDAQPRNMVRMAFLAIQCLETAMPYGGRIEISCISQRWTLHGKSEKLNFNPDLWDVLNAGAEPQDIAPAQVQFALLPAIAQDDSRIVKVDHKGSDIYIRF